MNTPATATVLLNRLKARARMRHLQVLVSLGELASVRRTAEALGLSQPAVTQSLADLERLVEIRLFDRHSRGLATTRAGRELLPLARRMLDALAEASEALTAARQRDEGVVRVAAISGAVGGLLVRALPAFANAHPGLTVQVQESAPEQWALQLARGEVDVALVRHAAVVPAGFEFRPLAEDRFAVVCRPAHALAQRRAVRWPTLARATWLPQAAGSAARELLDAQLAALGAQPPMVPVITRVATLTVAMVEALDVLALVPQSVVQPWIDQGRLVAIDVDPPMPFRPLGLVRPLADSARAVQLFCEHLQAHAAGASPAGPPVNPARTRSPARPEPAAAATATRPRSSAGSAKPRAPKAR
jgi:DNA-binding transcriptional LysR family regulator